MHICALNYLDLEKDLECPGRALLEPTPAFTTRDVRKTCRVKARSGRSGADGGRSENADREHHPRGGLVLVFHKKHSDRPSPRAVKNLNMGIVIPCYTPKPLYPWETKKKKRD